MILRISKQIACAPCVSYHLAGLKWVDLAALVKQIERPFKEVSAVLPKCVFFCHVTSFCIF